MSKHDVLQEFCGKQSMPTFHAYLDDSADRNRERVIVAGAVVATRTEWGMVNEKWRSRLQRAGLAYFKSSHCQGLAGQFHKFRQYGGEEGKRQALEIRDDLYQIIRNSPVMMLGVTLSVPFHRTMLGDTATFGRIPEVPYRLAFQQVIAECGKAMLLLGRGSVVTFWHDEGNDFKALHELYERFKELNPQYSNVLRDFAPLDDTQHPPMQAADVAAWMAYQFANDFCDNGGQVGPDNVIHRVDGHFYKIVNWLDTPKPYAPDTSSEQAPAIASYAQ